MITKAEPQRQVDCVADADANCDENLIRFECVIEHLKRRLGIEEVEAVVFGSREAERLAEPAWS